MASGEVQEGSAVGKKSCLLISTIGGLNRQQGFANAHSVEFMSHDRISPSRSALRAFCKLFAKISGRTRVENEADLHRRGKARDGDASFEVLRQCASLRSVRKQGKRETAWRSASAREKTGERSSFATKDLRR